MKLLVGIKNFLIIKMVKVINGQFLILRHQPETLIALLG